MKIKYFFLVFAIIINFTMPPLALAYHYETKHSCEHSSDSHHHEHECDICDDLQCKVQADLLHLSSIYHSNFIEIVENIYQRPKNKEHKTLVDLHVKLTE